MRDSWGQWQRATNTDMGGPKERFDSPETLVDLVAPWAAHRPDSPALRAPGSPDLSYGALRQLTESVASVLAGCGLTPHDPVAVVLRNGPEMAAACVTIASVAACA